MKIALINNLYYPFNKGGTEHIVEMCYQELKRKNIEVIIITTKPYFKKTAGADKNIYYLNSGYHFLDVIPTWLRLFWHIVDTFNFKKFFQIKKILKKENIDIVITHNLKGIGFLTPLAIKKRGIKHIHTLHDIQLLHPSGLMIYKKEKIINSQLAKLYQKFNILFFSHCHTVVSPSNWLLKLHENKLFFSRCNKKRICNPIPKKLINNNNGQNNKKSKQMFDFIYAGQIESQKAVLFLVDTFKEYLKLHPQSKTRLLLVGGGTKEAEIKKREDGKSIIFKGKMERQDTLNLMEKSDCLILPSICYENSPTAIYEASLVGLSIIASNIGGVPELIDIFGGKLFKPGDSQDLIDKIKKTAEADNNFGKEKDIKKFQLFSTQKYIQKLLQEINI